MNISTPRTPYNVYLARPISEGSMIARGRGVHRSKRFVTADAEAFDGEGLPRARASGTFMRSPIALFPEIGYE